MTDFNVPQISQLDPKQPDYVAKLEEGFVGLGKATELLLKEYEKTSQMTEENIADILREKGITVSQPKVLYEREERKGNILKKVRAVAVEIEAGDREEARRIEDLIDSYHETRDQEANNLGKELRSKVKILTRAFEDYVDAALKLTVIQPLNEINPDYPTAHFFVVRTNGVYEAHIDLTGEKSAQFYRNPNLDPKLFDDGSYVEDFRKKSEGIEANAYLVRNPLSALPIGNLGDYAVSNTVYLLLKERRQRDKEKEASKSVGQKLVDRIKSAMDSFKE